MDARRTWDVIVPKNPSLSREGFASERDARRYAERIGRTPQAMKDRGIHCVLDQDREARQRRQKH